MATKKNNDYDFKFDDKVEKDSLIYDHDRNDTPTEEEIANMPFKERMSYRFDYRVKALLTFLAVLIAVGSCIFYLCRPVDRPHVTAIALMDGIRFTLEDEKIVRKDFLNSLKDNKSYTGTNKEKTEKFFIYNYDYNSITDNNKFTGLLEKKRFDVIACKQERFEDLISTGDVMDLTKVLTTDQLQQLQDRIIYATTNKGETAYGILLENTVVQLRDNTTGGKEIHDAILCIPSSAYKIQEIRLFIDYFFKLN